MDQRNKPFKYLTAISFFLAFLAFVITLISESNNSGWNPYTSIFTIPAMFLYLVLAVVTYALNKAKKNLIIFFPLILILQLAPALLFISAL